MPIDESMPIRLHQPWSAYRLDPPANPGPDVLAGYSEDGRTVRAIPLTALTSRHLWGAHPMRQFSRRFDQEHRPVAPWTHTTQNFVGCESHLERSMVVLADFHPAVEHIAGQPITIVFPPGGPITIHTPDLVLLGGNRPPLIVDVKTPGEAAEATWIARFAVVRSALARAGFWYEVFTGMPRRYLGNLENFTEAWVPDEAFARWAHIAIEECAAPMRAEVLAERVDRRGYQYGFAMMLIRRLLWLRKLTIDWDVPFSAASTVWRAP